MTAELYQAHIPAAPDLDGKSVRAAFNSTSMAFLGDSVWEVRGCHWAIAVLLLLWGCSPEPCSMCAKFFFSRPLQLYARRKCLLPPSRTTTYYERVVATVRAEQQVHWLPVQFNCMIE